MIVHLALQRRLDHRLVNWASSRPHQSAADLGAGPIGQLLNQLLIGHPAQQRRLCRSNSTGV
jgi:hypothetical protein